MIKIRKVADFLETTVEDLIIEKENTQNFSNIENSTVVGSGNSGVNIGGNASDISTKEKIDLMFDKFFK